MAAAGVHAGGTGRSTVCGGGAAEHSDEGRRNATKSRFAVSAGYGINPLRFVSPASAERWRAPNQT
jgi:hypothetical protein